MSSDFHLVKTKFPYINGLFSLMDFDFGTSKANLDILFVSECGMRICSPIVNNVSSSETACTTAELLTLSEILLTLYSLKWIKTLEALNLSYDPIHNYSDTLTENITTTEQESGTKDDTATSTKSGTDKKTSTSNTTKSDKTVNTASQLATETGANNGTTTSNSTTTDTVSAFNSDGFQNSDASSSNSTTNQESNSSNSTNTTTESEATQTGTQGVTGEYNTTTSETVNNTSKTEEQSNINGTRVRESSHVGNIGNLTTQQLIREEIELYKHNFIREVINDVKEVLTLQIYC